MGKVIIHIAEAEISATGGMGRIAHHWREAFRRRGDEFIHIGPKEVGRMAHKSLFRHAALATCRRLGKKADVFLVHEPSAGAFVRKGVPTFVFSHGIERRGIGMTAEVDKSRSVGQLLRGMLTLPLWKLRARSCDVGLRFATKALLSNWQDVAYAKEHYGLTDDRVMVFRNGADVVTGQKSVSQNGLCRVLFLASWIARKGIANLAEAARILESRGVKLEWILAGTGVERDRVLEQWPRELASVTKVIPRFESAMEGELYAGSDIFVLPSHYEGQPLALLQAMAWGLCCITTDCCGQSDLIQSGKNGLLHRVGDVNALADMIQQCAQDPSLRASLGGYAAQSVAGRSWETVSNEIVDQIYAMLPKGKSK